ncbi:Heat-inducible transcription repressor HrcA [hydrothermal vent metagenome]|uniref:Heat-inducible transcription repressor HrcA n=1 Tax=hydrothermal vent metagenome TaxID=652676 RepID=A0A3B0XFA6_9ZZZZ
MSKDSSKSSIISKPLNQRSQYLLKTLINCYVDEGTPVGSKTLAETAGLNISTATIRNVMANLDAMGLVSAPHTSAGRVPTNMGFRMYVDSMLEYNPIEKAIKEKLQHELNPDQDKESLINIANNLLSDITQMAGVITLPKSGQLNLRRIEFLPLPDKKILAILVMNERDVQNRIMHVDKDYTQDELIKVSNYLNQHFMGKDIFQIRALLVKEMQRARTQVDELMAAAVNLASEALKPDDANETYRLQGQANLIRFNEADNANQLQQLFQVFQNKRDMLGLLDRCIQADDMQVFIGSEAGIDGLDDFSVISVPYGTKEHTLGILGVIGPTRMEYSKVISVVDITARFLSLALGAEGK